MTSLRRWVPLILLLVLGPLGAVAAPNQPVHRLPRISSADYRAAAQRARFAWGNDADNEAACHVIFHLDRNYAVLTIGLPVRTPRAEAEAWLRKLAASLDWRYARLYSYQDTGQLRVGLEGRVEARMVWPFRRRVWLEAGLLRQRMREITDQPVVFCLRNDEGTVFDVDPPPQARTHLGGSDYLFFSELPKSTSLLTFTYGLPPRHIAAIFVVGLIGLLFPIGPLWALRLHLSRNAGLTQERRQQLYERSQRMIRIAGIAGTFVAILLMIVGLVSSYFVATWPTVVPLWWWYGAIQKHFSLPVPAEEAPGAGDLASRASLPITLGWGVLTAAVMFVPTVITPQAMGVILAWIPILFVSCLILGAGFLFFAGVYLVRRTIRQNEDRVPAEIADPWRGDADADRPGA